MDTGIAVTERQGDHDPACGDPTTQKTIHRAVQAKSRYWSRSHVRSSIGDTSGYSITSMTPGLIVEDVREIRWESNLADLGTRQWFEIKVIPADTA